MVDIRSNRFFVNIEFDSNSYIAYALLRAYEGDNDPLKVNSKVGGKSSNEST